MDRHPSNPVIFQIQEIKSHPDLDFVHPVQPGLDWILDLDHQPIIGDIEEFVYLNQRFW